MGMNTSTLVVSILTGAVALGACNGTRTSIGGLGGAAAGGSGPGSGGATGSGGQPAGSGGDSPTVDGGVAAACSTGGTGNQAAGSLAVRSAGDYNPGRSYYSSIKLADVSGDGKPDLVVGGNASISVFVNRGDGTFRDKTEYITREKPRLAIGDLDGDGKPDLAAATDYPGGIDVLTNMGGGTFAPPVTYAATGKGTSIAIADLNGDGKNDIAVTSIYVDMATLVILTNTGGGTFSTTSLPAPPYVTSIAVGDLDGDSFPDIAIGDSGSGLAAGGVRLFINGGTGTFFGSGLPLGVTTNPYDAAIADVNGDGKNDLVLAGFTGNADVIINTGNGGFATPVAYSPGLAGPMPAASDPAALAMGDLDGDGKPDIAFVSQQAGLGAMLNRGNGTFAPPLVLGSCNLPVGVVANQIALGDLNGDGKLDIAATAPQGVSVFFNSTTR